MPSRVMRQLSVSKRSRSAGRLWVAYMAGESESAADAMPLRVEVRPLQLQARLLAAREMITKVFKCFISSFNYLLQICARISERSNVFTADSVRPFSTRSKNSRAS